MFSSLIGWLPKKAVLLFTVLLCIAAGLAWGYWRIFIDDPPDPPPLTYNEAYDEAQFQIQQYCKSLKRTPCDYYFVRVSPPPTEITDHWTFEFESAHHNPINILIYSDGDVDVLWN